MIWPTVPHFHDDDAPLLLLGDVLGRGRSSRLYRKLVIDEQVAQDVTAYQSGRELGGSFGIIVTLRPSRSISQARCLVEAELAALAAQGVTAEELHRVQNIRVASFLFALEHMGGFGGVADRLNAYNVFRGDPALITTDIRRFQGVDHRALGDVATSYLVGKPRVTLSVIGRSRSSRQRTAIDRAVPPASPEPTSYRPPVPEIIPLDGGVPLWFISRRDLPAVAGTIIITAGASVQQPGEAGLAHLTANMLDEGTTTRSAEEIALAVESMGGSVDASSGWDGSYVSFRCLKMHLAPILDLAVDILLNPTFPEREWDRLRGQTLAALKAERDNAESRAYRGLLSALFPADHPYRYPLAGSESCVAGFSRADLVRFHQQFLLTGVATIVAAGDVDPGETRRDAQ